MDLEEGDDGDACGGAGEILPRLFYNETGTEVGTGREHALDPRKRFMDHPGAAPPQTLQQGRQPGRISTAYNRDEARAVVALG